MQILTVEGEMTIFTASKQSRRLMNFLSKRDKEFELNLANVSEIDTAGLQLLTLLEHEAAQTGKTLRYVMHSKAVLEALELTRLTTTFSNQVVMAHNEA